MIPSFAKVKSEIKDLNFVQESLSLVFKWVLGKIILNGIYLENVVVKSTNTSIEHKLGRKVRGYIVTKKNVNTTIWDIEDSNPQPTRSLLLKAGSEVKISLWVF